VNLLQLTIDLGQFKLTVMPLRCYIVLGTYRCVK